MTVFDELRDVLDNYAVTGPDDEPETITDVLAGIRHELRRIADHLNWRNDPPETYDPPF